MSAQSILHEACRVCAAGFKPGQSTALLSAFFAALADLLGPRTKARCQAYWYFKDMARRQVGDFRADLDAMLAAVEDYYMPPTSEPPHPPRR